MNQELIKRLQAYIEREWLTRKQTGLAQGLAMIPPAGEIEQLLTNCLSALTAQQSQEPENTVMIMPHVHDLYAALGLKWGDNPFPVIQMLRDSTAPVSGVRAGMLRAAEICKEWEGKLSQGAGYAIRTAREAITRAAGGQMRDCDLSQPHAGEIVHSITTDSTMARDEVLAMAREAGISESQFMPGYIHATMANIERFHTLAVAKEREECATTAENVNGEHYMADSLPEHIAELIRARSAK